jgi:hypothetical protein
MGIGDEVGKGVSWFANVFITAQVGTGVMFVPAKGNPDNLPKETNRKMEKLTISKRIASNAVFRRILGKDFFSLVKIFGYFLPESLLDPKNTLH